MAVAVEANILFAGADGQSFMVREEPGLYEAKVTVEFCLT